ncbi:MAG: M23 family metallopeptidase [Acidiferrobacterales bacterium]|nr:M23 family metallopeptidase [Acidiferrobacterales bacterium]
MVKRVSKLQLGGLARAQWTGVGLLLPSLVLAASDVSAGTLTLAGPLVQGGLVQGRTDADATVIFEGKKVRVSEDGVFLIGFSRNFPRKATLSVTFANGSQETRTLKIKQRKYKTQRINGLPPKMVTPSAKDLERISVESAQIKRTRKRDDARTDFLTGFIWPTVGRISGIYGSQRILNGEPRRPHYGVDVAVPTGTPVLAPADGIVSLAHPDMYFTGGTLIVDHGHGLVTSYFHLSRVLVKQDQAVRQGEVIAEIGATGRVTGAHLHWSLNLFDRPLDPQLLMKSHLARNTSTPSQITLGGTGPRAADAGGDETK